MERDHGIDLMKTIAILMVISLHVPVWNEWFSVDEFTRLNLIQYLIRVFCEGVPIFVMVNGYLIIGKQTDLITHIKKTIKIIILLVIWAIILILVLSFGVEQQTALSVLKYLLSTQNGSSYTGTLWYLQSLIALYFLYPGINFIYINNKKLFKYLIVIVGCFSIITKTINELFDLLCSCGITSNIYLFSDFIYKLNPIANGAFLFYFMMGAWIKDNRERIKKLRIIFIVIGIVMWLLSFKMGITISRNSGSLYRPSFNYSSIVMVALILALYSACSYYQAKNLIIRKIIELIGKNTLGMYLTHFIIISYINRVTCEKGLSLRLLEMVIVFIASLIVSVVLRKIPLLSKLVST